MALTLCKYDRGVVYCVSCRHCRVLCFCTRVVWVCLLLSKEEGSSPVSLQLLRTGIWACMRYTCLCIGWVLDGDYVSQFPYVWYYVGVKSSFQHAREEGESKRGYGFSAPDV